MVVTPFQWKYPISSLKLDKHLGGSILTTASVVIYSVFENRMKAGRGNWSSELAVVHRDDAGISGACVWAH